MLTPAALAQAANGIAPNHRRAVRYSQAGKAQRLAACLAVRREMGGTKTLTLSHDMLCSTDTIERMGRAAFTYLALRQYAGQKKKRLQLLRDARRQCDYTHFEVLGKWWLRIEFSPEEAMHYLQDILNHRYSTRALDEAIAADHGKGRTAAGVVYPVWQLNDETLERLRTYDATARVVVVSGLDDSVREVTVKPVAALARAMGTEAGC